MSKRRSLVRAYTFDSVPCWVPPTLLEDGQCYRGNQLKQGLDGREVLGLDGKNVQHLRK